MARKTTYDQEMVTELRMELVKAGLAIMQNKAEVKRWSALKKEFVLKAAVRSLPILNAGRTPDEPFFPPPLLNGLSTNNSNREVAENEEENP